MAAPIAGVYLDAADTALMIRIIDELAAKSKAIDGRGLGASVLKLRTELDRANGRVNAQRSNVRANVNSAVGERDTGQIDIYEFIDTATAARILGLTPGGVRHRARTGTIGSRKAGGRYVYSLNDCERVAAERAHGLRRH